MADFGGGEGGQEWPQKIGHHSWMFPNRILIESLKGLAGTNQRTFTYLIIGMIFYGVGLFKVKIL